MASVDRQTRSNVPAIKTTCNGTSKPSDPGQDGIAVHGAPRTQAAASASAGSSDATAATNAGYKGAV